MWKNVEGSSRGLISDIVFWLKEMRESLKISVWLQLVNGPRFHPRTYRTQIINSEFIKKNPTRCNNVPKFYYSIFIWSSTCFRRHTAHHQEPKTALAASGFSYVKGCWTCIWRTVSTKYTSNNLLLMKNQRLPVQF